MKIIHIRISAIVTYEPYSTIQVLPTFAASGKHDFLHNKWAARQPISDVMDFRVIQTQPVLVTSRQQQHVSSNQRIEQPIAKSKPRKPPLKTSGEDLARFFDALPTQDCCYPENEYF